MEPKLIAARTSKLGAKRERGGFPLAAVVGAGLIALGFTAWVFNRGTDPAPPKVESIVTAPSDTRFLTSTPDLRSPVAMPRQVGEDNSSVSTALGASFTGRSYLVGPKLPPAAVAAGFRPGDIVVTINGREVSNPDRDARIFLSSEDTGAATFEVYRDSRKTTISYPLG